MSGSISLEIVLQEVRKSNKTLKVKIKWLFATNFNFHGTKSLQTDGGNHLSSNFDDLIKQIS